MVNATSEYIPEHGRSTANSRGCSGGLLITIVGGPYFEDSVTGTSTIFSNVNEACALKFPSAAPAGKVTGEGGGIKKNRNRMGKIRAMSVLTLNRMRVIPMTNITREAMWYSSG